MEQCARQVKKVSLELGGNAPFLVFDDADLADALASGAELIAGGERHERGHTFFRPTVLSGVTATMAMTEVAPFGGMKESGIGREGSKYGIEEWSS
jgi:acyl-CoA reductase-like NAD-dependent aldehyde dehydrogenase